MNIHPNISLISGIISKCYVLSDFDSLSIVDCGVSMDFHKILKSLKELGYPDKPLKNIFITHADGDHYGAALRIQEITKARVFSSPIEIEAIKRGGSSRPLKGSRLIKSLMNLFKPLFEASPLSVCEPIVQSEILSVFTEMQVLETPGHTPGHISFWLKEPQILFAGDSIWEKSGQPMASSGINTWDLGLSKKSFDFQMNLRPKIICAGHTCLLLNNKEY